MERCSCFLLLRLRCTGAGASRATERGACSVALSSGLQEPLVEAVGRLPVQSLSRVRLCATPWTAARQASLSIASSRSSLKLRFIESVMPSNHLLLCRPLLLAPSIFPSIWVFSSESALRIRWPQYWSFSFNISPSIEHSGLIPFRMDWLDLLAVQGTLKSLSNTTVEKQQFFGAQLSLCPSLTHT